MVGPAIELRGQASVAREVGVVASAVMRRNGPRNTSSSNRNNPRGWIAGRRGGLAHGSAPVQLAHWPVQRGARDGGRCSGTSSIRASEGGSFTAAESMATGLRRASEETAFMYSEGQQAASASGRRESREQAQARS